MQKILFEGEAFDLRKTLESGQAFHWKDLGDGRFIVAGQESYAIFSQSAEGVVIDGDKTPVDMAYWRRYFDLDTDYRAIADKVAIDSVMRAATAFGEGIRIMNQPAFETIITFILSANNNVKRIQQSVHDMSKRYGAPLGVVEGDGVFAFPTPQDLAVSPEELRTHCGTGYRDAYIVNTARILAEDADWERRFCLMDDRELHQALKVLPGVGPKVADCIMLFAFGRGAVFPVDVWIRRVMEALYMKEPSTPSAIVGKAQSLFGDVAGYAQQYLFYYGRTKGNAIVTERSEKN